MKHFLLGVLFALLALFIGGFAYLRLGFAEVRGDLPPSRWENALMISAVHASVRRHAPETPNPVPPRTRISSPAAKFISMNAPVATALPESRTHPAIAFIPPFHSSLKPALLTPRRKSFGWPSTASAFRACSPMANGNPTKSCGPRPPTSSASSRFLPVSSKNLPNSSRQNSSRHISHLALQKFSA